MTDLGWTQMISPSFHDFTIFRIIKCGLQKKLFSDKMVQENSCKDKGNIKIFTKLHIYKMIYLKWKIYKILHIIQVSIFRLVVFITFQQSAFFYLTSKDHQILQHNAWERSMDISAETVTYSKFVGNFM